jgi:zinc protease
MRRASLPSGSLHVGWARVVDATTPLQARSNLQAGGTAMPATPLPRNARARKHWVLPIAGMLTLVAGAPVCAPALAASNAETFTLGNGMQVCVIPDHRVAVATHMVFYRTGGADDPSGRSGLAHFLEHLMFKGTDKTRSGEFTRTVTGLGGRHNALTTHDSTAYFQRVAKEHLKAVMALEADRMQGLLLEEKEVLTERDVVAEERRGSVDGNPISALNEQMMAALYQNHTYRRPVLGWSHEIAGLRRADALTFYKAHYAPNNAILVVAGDVTAAEVRRLAEETYGRNRPSPTIAERQRPTEPEHRAERRVRLEDPRAGQPMLLRFYHTPSYASAKPGEAEALAVLARILGGDDTSRLYRHLVLETKLAAHAGADFQGSGRDSGRLALLALAARDGPTDAMEAALDRVVAELQSGTVGEDELRRAKRVLEAEHVFETDDQEKRARRYGEALTAGRSLADFEASLRHIEAVTAADVKRVAASWLEARRSVTGQLARPRAEAARGEGATARK